MHAAEHLESVRWTHPSHYAGFSPDGDYLILSRHRDSDLIEESNWDAACRILHAQAWDSGTLTGRPAAYHWRAGCSMSGWVEYLCVRSDAPDSVLQEAGEIVCSLADYPVLDDDDLSTREDDAVCEYWRNESVRGRLDLIRDTRAAVSAFAARRDEFPADDTGDLYQWVRDIVA